ncbi:MAG: anthranilate phosphoribosyltransferase, partial [Armatimonadota bacterium]
RGVTSSCGSADVLEALGVRLVSEVKTLTRLLEDTGLTFMFAQHHHPAMRHVIGVRKALGVRTVFNLLGPLTNPAGAQRQMIGLYDWNCSAAVADALVLLGVELAYLVHAREGLDEISPVGLTDVIEIKEGSTRRLTWGPADFGLRALEPNSLTCGGDVGANARILREALSDASSPRALALVPNAACALLLAGLVTDLPSGAELALATIKSGRAEAKLDEYARATHEVAV